MVSGSQTTELPQVWTARVDHDVTAVSVSKDARLFAVGTGSGTLFVFEASSGALQFQVRAHPGGVLSLDWSPRAHVLASSGQDGHARLFDARGNQLAALRGVASWVEHVAWSSDGENLATGSGDIVQIWTSAGDLAWKTDPHESAVTGLAWSKRGSDLATVCYGGVQLFRVAPKPTTRRFPWRGSPISLAWSPTGSVIACGTQDGSVRFWRVATGQDSQILGFRSQPRALAWDSEGRLLATAGDSSVHVWAFESGGPEGSPPIRLDGHQALCTALAFHPTAPVLASGADDTRVLLWRPRQQRTPLAAARLDDQVTGIAWALQGKRLLAVDAAGTVCGWQIDSL